MHLHSTVSVVSSNTSEGFSSYLKLWSRIIKLLSAKITPPLIGDQVVWNYIGNFCSCCLFFGFSHSSRAMYGVSCFTERVASYIFWIAQRAVQQCFEVISSSLYRMPFVTLGSFLKCRKRNSSKVCSSLRNLLLSLTNGNKCLPCTWHIIKLCMNSKFHS